MCGFAALEIFNVVHLEVTVQQWEIRSLKRSSFGVSICASLVL